MAVAPASPQPIPLEARLQRLARRFLSIAPLLIPPVLVLLIYLPAVQYQLVWDDTIFLSDMPVYRMPDGWLQAIRAPFVLSPNYFRPLALLSFVLEESRAGLNPALFHFTNLLLHALNALLVSLLAWDLVRGHMVGAGLRPAPTERSAPTQTALPVWFATALGLVYALHPALVEGVAFISSRFDLLGTFFLLLALLAERRLSGWRRLVVSAAAFLLAALTKEMAVALLLALPFWFLAQIGSIASNSRNSTVEKRPRIRRWLDSLDKRWKDAASLFAALLCAGLVYLLIRFAALGYLLASPERSIPSGDLLSRLLLVARSLASYLRLVIWPFGGLAPIHYSPLPVSPGDFGAWLELGIVILAGIAVAHLVRSSRPALRQSGWLILAGSAALLPVSNLLPLELGGGAFIAERFLVFPMGFFVLSLAPLLALAGAEATAQDHSPIEVPPTGREPLPEPEPLEPAAIVRLSWKLPLAGLLLSAWLVASWAALQLTLPHWRDDLSLWQWAQARAPYSSTPLTNLSLQATNQGQAQQGAQLAQQAVALDPANGNAWNNLGLALLHMQQPADSEQAFRKAIELEPENPLYWNNLAGVLRDQDQLQDAEKILLDQALRLDPYLPAAHLNLGIVYLKADRPDLAQVELQKAAALLPPDQLGQAQEMLAKTQDPAIWLRLGDLLLGQGQFQGAAQAFDTAGRLGAAPADVAAGLGTALVQLGQIDQAIQLLTNAIQQAPQDARLYNNLGMAFLAKGEIDSARQLFQKAIELAPDWETPQKNLEGLPEQ
jgi:Flp pilus assembly protein TadD